MDKKYSANSQKPKAGKRDPSLLKNIRQIGMPSLGYKLYIEDSVLSYLKNQMKKEDSRVIALIGSETETEDATCLFVEGAIKVDDIFVSGKNLSFGKKAFTNLYEDMNTFFDDCSLLGWYVPMYEMIRTYGSTLGEKCKLFVLDDPTSQGEMFYIKEMSRIKKLNGYNIYFEKNEPMKSYLLSCKETLERENEQEERKQIKEPGEKREPLQVKNSNKKDASAPADNFRFTPFLYAASSVLAIVVLVVGITMMSNYEKMHDMQASLETLANRVTDTITGNSSEDEDNEESAVVTEIPQTTEPVEATEEASESEVVIPEEESTVTSNQVDIVEYYVVKEGDTLAGISMKLYDSMNMVDEICEINSIENEDSLYIGQKIYLPRE